MVRNAAEEKVPTLAQPFLDPAYVHFQISRPSVLLNDKKSANYFLRNTPERCIWRMRRSAMGREPTAFVRFLFSPGDGVNSQDPWSSKPKEFISGPPSVEEIFWGYKVSQWTAPESFLMSSSPPRRRVFRSDRWLWENWLRIFMRHL